MALTLGLPGLDNGINTLVDLIVDTFWFCVAIPLRRSLEGVPNLFLSGGEANEWRSLTHIAMAETVERVSKLHQSGFIENASESAIKLIVGYGQSSL